MEYFEIDWLKIWSQHSPNANALKDADSDKRYTYASLYFLSCRLASRLRDRFDIKKGDRVAILSTNEMEFLPLFFAVQRLGAILVPINFRLAGREVAHILEDSAPALVICQQQFQNLLESAGPKVAPKHLWWLDGNDSLTAWLSNEEASFGRPSDDIRLRLQNPEWALPIAGEFESPCMLIYTSGTTGAPKGAMITNKMLHWNAINTELRLDITQKDVSVAFAPFFHTGGWNVLLTPFLHHGASTILLRKFDAKRILDIVEKEQVTIMFGVPTMLDMISRCEEFKTADLSSLRYMIVGGEPMSIELIKTWHGKHIPIRQGYGLTEFGPNVFSLNEEDSLRKIGSIGMPNFYIEARVVDDEGQVLPIGEIGELVLKGPVCTPGYWHLPEATSQTIRNGWLHTGDLVRRDNEGYFYVEGRKKDMYKSGGENVYPVEVERFLSSHPAIREVAVIGVPDSKWGEVGKAFVALKAEASLTAEELIEFCQGNLARFKIPRYVEILAELPKSDSGKILKRALRG